MDSEFDVRVVPRSSRNKLELQNGSLKAWVHASPTEGQANKAVCELIAEALKISKSSVEIVRGESSRTKGVRIYGLDSVEVQKRLTS